MIQTLFPRWIDFVFTRRYNQITDEGVRAVLQRCIVIFPGFEEERGIEGIRRRYDPLFGVVKPHITLVFPFESEWTKGELHAHISSALSSFRPFPVRMGGVSAHRQPDGNDLFLDVLEGGESIRQISRRLYEGALAKYRSARYNASYIPHMTLGRFQDDSALESALSDIGSFPHEFTTVVRHIDVEVLGEDGSSAIEMSVPLPTTL